jgi:hypothetical protein
MLLDINPEDTRDKSQARSAPLAHHRRIAPFSFLNPEEVTCDSGGATGAIILEIYLGGDKGRC